MHDDDGFYVPARFVVKEWEIKFLVFIEKLFILPNPWFVCLIEWWAVAGLANSPRLGSACINFIINPSVFVSSSCNVFALSLGKSHLHTLFTSPNFSHTIIHIILISYHPELSDHAFLHCLFHPSWEGIDYFNLPCIILCPLWSIVTVPFCLRCCHLSNHDMIWSFIQLPITLHLTLSISLS